MFGTTLRRHSPIKWLALTGMLMSMNIVMSSFGIPVPGGHLYLNDVIICVGALLMDPLGAFMIGGVGAFLGDFFFYPAPMFVSLVTHGVQACVISIIFHYGPKTGALRREDTPAAALGLALGILINVAGYSLGRAFVYGTPAAAMMKLPFQIFQASFGAVMAGLLYFKADLRGSVERSGA